MNKRSIRQRVSKTKQNNGKNFFKEIGSIGGINTTTRFNSETGRSAANKRWEAYREKQKELENEKD